MYQALYRKYRPRAFSDVLGQEHVTVTLQRQIISGRLSHAYLFVGTRGTGKTSCAKILSRAINCQNPVNGNPCNTCASCVGIENGSILDVLELDAASNNGVDDVRALREEAIYSPATVNKRVYIIDEAHMLSNSAFNALLKILEEPPEHLVFILATTALHKIPATILSRCQRFSFKRISPTYIIAMLSFVSKNEGFTLTEDAANELALLADGSMRDALSLLDQCASDTAVDLQRVLDTIGLVGRQEILKLVDSIAVRDTATALDILDRTYNDGRDMSSLLSEMASLLRDILVYKLSPDSPLQRGGFSREGISSLSEKFSTERLFFCLEIIREAVFNLSRGVGVKLTVEMCLISMCDERLSDDMPALLSRIARLEGAFAQGSGIRGQGSEVRGQGSEVRDQGSEVRGQESGDEERNAEFGIKNEGEAGIPNPELTEPLKSETDQTEVDSQRLEASGSDHINSEFRIPNSEFTDSASFWANVLEHFKNDMSIYSLLSDSSRVNAELRDDALIIRAGDMFIISLIESKKFSDPLKEVARKILGRDISIRVEVGGDNSDEVGRKKIDDLDKFGVVKFE